MPDPSKIQWPLTYLGRLQAVSTELKNIGVPTSIEALVDRFSGVTSGEVEAILNALVLFGRAEKSGEGYSALEEL